MSEKGETFSFFLITSVNIDFMKKCYDSQFVRDKNFHKSCDKTVFPIWTILHVINKFCRKMHYYVPPARKLVFPLQLRVTECCIFSYRGI